MTPFIEELLASGQLTFTSRGKTRSGLVEWDIHHPEGLLRTTNLFHGLYKVECLLNPASASRTLSFKGFGMSDDLARLEEDGSK